PEDAEQEHQKCVVFPVLIPFCIFRNTLRKLHEVWAPVRQSDLSDPNSSYFCYIQYMTTYDELRDARSRLESYRSLVFENSYVIYPEVLLPLEVQASDNLVGIEVEGG